MTIVDDDRPRPAETVGTFPLDALSLQLGQTGRYMTCANDPEPESARWAYMAPMEVDGAPDQSLPVRFMVDPTQGPAAVTMENILAEGGNPLYLTFTATEAQGDLFWWTTDASSATLIRATFTTSGYQLSYASASGTQYLISTATDDTWFIYGGPQGLASVFVPEPYFVPISVLALGLLKSWPSLTTQSLETMHPISGERFQPVYKDQATAFQTAAQYQPYSAGNFDCEDFSLVLKAQASVQAALNHTNHGYAFALLTGSDATDQSHALCLFWGPSLTAYLIEPQSGAITKASDWTYTPTFLLI